MSDLRVVELDFDPIKENLKKFLQGQEYFTDYDFEGSAMSILLDLLAYDTHYKAYIANMVINERFLDTSVKRASVVSHSKTLGYLPRSYRSAKAVVNVTVYGVSTEYTMTLDKYTQFSCDINGESFTFVTLKSYSAIPSSDNTYKFENVELYEGSVISFDHVATQSGTGQMFMIPALNVDTSTLSVVVQKSNTDTTVNAYSYADSVSVVKSTDLVYYLEENADGYYYVYFGDDNLGKSISSGNIIKLTYLVTKGSAANTNEMYSQVFKLSGNIGGYFDGNAIVELVSSSNGGAEKQDINEIRFNAPKNYSAQGRAVTLEDFKSLLIKDFPIIDSITTWGGEDNVPPIYGKVFLSIKPKNGYTLDNTTKDNITQYLRKKTIVTIQSEFVDPEFTFVSINNNIKFNSNLTNKDSNQIEKLASDAIKYFFTESLQRFDKKLYISKLQSAIDSLDRSILGNTIVVGLQKRFDPVFGLTSSYKLYFNNRIVPYSVSSSTFTVMTSSGAMAVILKDVSLENPPNPEGVGKLIMINPVTNQTISDNIGSVNYATGFIEIKSLNVIGYPSKYLYDVRVNCRPQSHIDEISNTIVTNIKTEASIPIPMQNQILMLDDSVAIPEFYMGSGLTVVAEPIIV